MTPTDHERCSESLPVYMDEGLDANESAWVSAHLEGCAECRSELAALRALRGVDDTLTEIERARLHRGVLDELDVRSSRTDASRLGWGPRAARLLGAAATVALLIGGLVYLGDGLGGGDDGDAGGGGEQAVQDADAGGDDLLRESASSGGAAAQDVPATKAAPPTATYQEDLGRVDDRALKRTGRRERPFIGFPAHVEVTAVQEYRRSFLDALVEQAPEELGDQLRACATDVLAQIPTAVATFAAPAEYGDPPRAVLVIGFAYSFSEQGFLDQYQMWIYPRGSCDFPTNYIGGRIGG